MVPDKESPIRANGSSWPARGGEEASPGWKPLATPPRRPPTGHPASRPHRARSCRPVDRNTDSDRRAAEPRRPAARSAGRLWHHPTASRRKSAGSARALAASGWRRFPWPQRTGEPPARDRALSFDSSSCPGCFFAGPRKKLGCRIRPVPMRRRVMMRVAVAVAFPLEKPDEEGRGQSRQQSQGQPYPIV